MPKRCSDTHFYVAGHKTRSGYAVYTAPDGTELVVVCGRNRPGPGQIHLRDVPDGVTLAVTGQAGTLELELDQDATRGRKGRFTFDDTYEEIEPGEPEETFVLNCLAELPRSAGEGWNWAQTVTFLAMMDVRSSDRLRWIRSHDVARHLDADSWELLARNASRHSESRRALRRMARQAVHRLDALDPVTNRRAYQAALQAAAMTATAVDVPDDALCRLQAHLLRNGPGPGREAVFTLLKTKPQVVTALARQWCAERGTPGAAQARAFGLETYRRLLDVASASAKSEGIGQTWMFGQFGDSWSTSIRRGSWWSVVSVLADPNAATLHRYASRIIGDDPPAPVTPPGVSLLRDERWDECFEVVYKLACPEAREMLEARAPRWVAQMRERANARETADTEDSLPQRDEWADVERRWRTELDVVEALVTGASLDPVARARSFFRDGSRALTGGPLESDGSGLRATPARAVVSCLESGLDDLGKVERLISAHAQVLVPPGEKLRFEEQLALAESGVYTSEDYVLLRLAGAATPRDVAALATGRPYDVAFATRCPIDDAVRTTLGAAGGNERDYVYFKGASVDDPAEMAARLQAGVSGTRCLELTALGVTERDAQRDAVERLAETWRARRVPDPWDALLPRTRRRIAGPDEESDFAGYIAAGFDAPQLDEALTLRLPPSMAADAAEANVPAVDILPAWEEGLLATVTSYFQHGAATSTDDVRVLVEHAIPVTLAVEYAAAGIKDAKSMVVFKQAGIVDQASIAAHLARASRPSTATVLFNTPTATTRRGGPLF